MTLFKDMTHLNIAHSFAIKLQDYLSALHIAAHCGHVEIAQILITHKAHVDCKALVSQSCISDRTTYYS